MEFTRLQPIPGVPANERTEVTKKSIKELLEQEGVDANQLLSNSAAARDSEEQPHIQQPPHMQHAVPVQKLANPFVDVTQGPVELPAAELEQDSQVIVESNEKPRSFFKRMIGG